MEGLIFHPLWHILGVVLFLFAFIIIGLNVTLFAVPVDDEELE